MGENLYESLTVVFAFKALEFISRNFAAAALQCPECKYRQYHPIRTINAGLTHCVPLLTLLRGPFSPGCLTSPGPETYVAYSERRQRERFRIRVPLRFRPLGLASGPAEHFAETTNVSRGGFFFVTSAPLQVGMPIEATLMMPSEVTGGASDETHCRARLVHAKPDAYSDGRMGFGAEIEMFIEPKKSGTPTPARVPNPVPGPAKP
jgi:PilZ domain